MTNYIKQAKKRYVKEFGGNPVMMQEQVWEWIEKEIKKARPDDEFYAEKSKKDWIEWAEKEIEEYENFIDFLEGDLDDARSGGYKARGRSSVSDDSKKSIKKRKK